MTNLEVAVGNIAKINMNKIFSKLGMYKLMVSINPDFVLLFYCIS